MFGSVSAPNVFPWGDMNVGEMITCSGRQYLRQMVRFFAIKGFEPLVLDTDGCNFAIPADVEKYRYIGKGTHRFVDKDKEYTGVEACVSEYNEIYMRGVMGLDVDEVITATITLSRKNYANLEPSGKIKLTGNTIKSKTLSDIHSNHLLLISFTFKLRLNIFSLATLKALDEKSSANKFHLLLS